jgi:hypothetical protein
VDYSLTVRREVIRLKHRESGNERNRFESVSYQVGAFHCLLERCQTSCDTGSNDSGTAGFNHLDAASACGAGGRPRTLEVSLVSHEPQVN